MSASPCSASPRELLARAAVDQPARLPALDRLAADDLERGDVGAQRRGRGRPPSPRRRASRTRSPRRARPRRGRHRLAFERGQPLLERRHPRLRRRERVVAPRRRAAPRAASRRAAKKRRRSRACRAARRRPAAPSVSMCGTIWRRRGSGAARASRSGDGEVGQRGVEVVDGGPWRSSARCGISCGKRASAAAASAAPERAARARSRAARARRRAARGRGWAPRQRVEVRRDRVELRQRHRRRVEQLAEARRQPPTLELVHPPRIAPTCGRSARRCSTACGGVGSSTARCATLGCGARRSSSAARGAAAAAAASESASIRPARPATRGCAASAA